MSTALCKTSVLRLYNDVIDDVITNVRELFIEDGVDEQVLQELKQTWETKLMASKAVHNEQEEKAKKQMEMIATTNGFAKQQVMPMNQVVQQGTPIQPVTQVVETKMVPIQITLPPQPGADPATQRILTIQVPATALQGNQLQKVLTGPVITATMNLPVNIASSLLQQHVNAAFNSQQQSVAIVSKPVLQTDGPNDYDSDDDAEVEFVLPPLAGPLSAQPSGSGQLQKGAGSAALKRKKTSVENRKNRKVVTQSDGSLDTSDEDDDASEDNDDDEDLDDDKDEEDQEMEDEGGEEEPLNSEDDVTDDDPTDLFDTDNIVVCQYDKIIRNRNKWKFYLKDGIMNLNGIDYVFQKANGDAEW